MGKKTIVVTMYGKNESVETISISLFDRTGSYYHSESKNNAIEYCNNINDLELKDNHWIHASIVGENEKMILGKPPKFDFDIINQLSDRSIQKVLRDVDKIDLAKALQDIDEEIKENIFKNMTKRAAAMLKEDIEALHEVNKDDIKLSQRKIIEVIRHLILTGEIVIGRKM